MDTLQIEDDVISTSIRPVVEDKDDDDIDWPWIIALICFGVGALLIIVGICRLCVWAIEQRKHRRYSKWWLRQMEHKRHLEEYSIRTGDAISVQSHVTSPKSQVGESWSSCLNENEAFTPDEGPRDTSSRKDVEYGLPSNGVSYANEMHNGNYALQNGGYENNMTHGGSSGKMQSHKDMLHFL